MGTSFEILRPQLVAGLSGGLPGPEAQRLFAPELAYGRHAGPPSVGSRQAAVLVLAYPHEGEWYVPTMVRSHSLKEHAGQIALPGGSVDAGETPAQTALREFEEELGASRGEIDVLGALTPIYVFNSNFYVRPFLGLCLARPDFQPNAAEVAELIEIPLRALLSPENHSSHQIHRRGITFRVPHIQIGQHRVWGATCMILAEVMALMTRCPVFVGGGSAGLGEA
ncbi:MAG: CoA pyrophosphatase [Pirellulaceae bacterium]|nr:CoA pyrophosphatase [Pirellulaceae bacterium]